MHDDPAVQDFLSQSGLWNFFQIPLMRSTKLLLDKIVIFWDREAECFIIQDERIEITLRDVYFLNGLPVLGMITNTMPKLTQGVSLDYLHDRHCYASTFLHSLYILVCDIKSLQT